MTDTDPLTRANWRRAATPAAAAPEAATASRSPHWKMAQSPYATATTPRQGPHTSSSPKYTSGSTVAKPANSTT